MPENLLNLLSKVGLMSTGLDVHFKRTSVSGVNRPNVGDKVHHPKTELYGAEVGRPKTWPIIFSALQIP